MSDDPCEKPIAEALTFAKIDFLSGTGRNKAPDFEVGGTAIECKQFYSSRAIEQMSRHNNAILVQGRGAALWFADAVRGNGAALIEAEKRGYERGIDDALALADERAQEMRFRASIAKKPDDYRMVIAETEAVAAAIRALKEKA